MLRTVLLLSLLLATLCGAAQARTLEVGPGKELRAPSAAAAVAQDGDRITIQPGSYFDCAVWRANRLVIEGAGPADQVVMTDQTCQGKAIFVTVGNNITVRNLTLTRARVPDGNGAGIRAEGQDLVVEGVRFINNQNGILSGTQGGMMTIRDSLFDRNGSCEQACAHGVYVGQLDRLLIQHSTFTATKEAHHIKSRARRTEVIDCTIQDGPEGTASYEVEVPNGGALVVRGSNIEKGPNAQNHSAAIVIGSEGVNQPTPEILIEGNTFRNDNAVPTVFVNNLSATDAVLRNNRLTGQVRPLKGDGQVVPAP